ncbi:uncharacterized protein LOC134842780 isoform X2 [Symsagittifera roscoffensis]|uniref:uncharacterized protein LOC134842780 isoform X2 n=1 Tax=Symsagittifera roscoffensis TaxID=84072 RepID=UPI00307CBC67
MTAAMGSVINILVSHLEEVSEQKLLPETTNLIYFCNILPLPLTHALLVSFLDQSDYSDLYTCFPPFLSISGAFSLGPCGLYLLLGALLAFFVRNATENMSLMLDEEEVILYFESAHRNTNFLLMLCPAVFGFTVYAWDKDSLMYHVIEAAVIALFSVILYWMMVLAPPEIKEAFVSHNQIEMPEVKKKKRKSPSAHYKPQTDLKNSETIDRNESPMSNFSIGSNFFGAGSDTTGASSICSEPITQGTPESNHPEVNAGHQNSNIHSPESSSSHW